MGGTKVSVNRQVIAEPAGGAEWIDSSVVIFNMKVGEPDKWAFYSRSLSGELREILDQGVNEVAGGGGVWAGWNPRGIFSNKHPQMPKAGLKGVGPDGTLAYCPDRQDGRKLILRSLAGSEILLTQTATLSVQVIDSHHAIWIQGGKVWSSLGDPTTAPGPCWTPRTVVHEGKRFLLYYNEQGGVGRLLLQPEWGVAKGWVITTGPAYRPDIGSFGEKLRVCWSLTEAEGPSSIRDMTFSVDLPTESLVFSAPPPPPPEPPSMDQINPTEITWLHTDVSKWKITSDLSEVSLPLQGSGIELKHSKAGSWPKKVLDGTAVEGNPWVFAKIGGKWYGATFEWLRPGQTFKPNITRENLGPHTKKAPLSTWVPEEGEEVGFAISGLARDSNRNIEERSQIVKVKWGKVVPPVEPPPPPPPLPPPVEPPPPPVEPPPVICQANLGPVLEGIEDLATRLITIERLLRAERVLKGLRFVGDGKLEPPEEG